MTDQAPPHGGRRVAYRSALRNTVALSAGPYGYTLSVWTSGAVLAHARGLPSSLDAVLFLLGAVAGYALVGALAFGGFSSHSFREPAHAVVWGGLHFFSVGVALGAATLEAHALTNALAWPLVGFTVTALYLLGSALQLAVVDRVGGERATPVDE